MNSEWDWEGELYGTNSSLQKDGVGVKNGSDKVGALVADLSNSGYDMYAAKKATTKLLNLFDVREEEYLSDISERIDAAETGEERLRLSIRVLCFGDVQSGKTLTQNLMCASGYLISFVSSYTVAMGDIREQTFKRFRGNAVVGDYFVLGGDTITTCGSRASQRKNHAQTIAQNVMSGRKSVCVLAANSWGAWEVVMNLVKEILEEHQADAVKNTKVLIINDESDVGDKDTTTKKSSLDERKKYNAERVGFEQYVNSNFGGTHVIDFTATPQSNLGSNFYKNENEFYSGVVALERRDDYVGVKKMIESNRIHAIDDDDVFGNNGKVVKDSVLQSLLLKATFETANNVIKKRMGEVSLHRIADISLRLVRNTIGVYGDISEESVAHRAETYRRVIGGLLSQPKIIDDFAFTLEKDGQIFNENWFFVVSTAKDIINSIKVVEVRGGKSIPEADKLMFENQFELLVINTPKGGRGITVKGLNQQITVKAGWADSGLYQDTLAQMMRVAGSKSSLMQNGDGVNLYTTRSVFQKLVEYVEWVDGFLENVEAYNLLNEVGRMDFNWGLGHKSSRHMQGCDRNSFQQLDGIQGIQRTVKAPVESVAPFMKAWWKKSIDNDFSFGRSQVVGGMIGVDSGKELFEIAGGCFPELVLGLVNADELFDGYDHVIGSAGFKAQGDSGGAANKHQIKHTDGILVGKWMSTRSSKIDRPTTNQVISGMSFGHEFDLGVDLGAAQFDEQHLARKQELNKNSLGHEQMLDHLKYPMFYVNEYVNTTDDKKWVMITFVTPGEHQKGERVTVMTNNSGAKLAESYGLIKDMKKGEM
jgi:hypothetical protein